MSLCDIVSVRPNPEALQVFPMPHIRTVGGADRAPISLRRDAVSAVSRKGETRNNLPKSVTEPMKLVPDATKGDGAPRL